MLFQNVGITGNLMFAGTMICIGQSLVFGYNLGVLNQHVNVGQFSNMEYLNIFKYYGKIAL